jgi:hypothetical protein
MTYLSNDPIFPPQISLDGPFKYKSVQVFINAHGLKPWKWNRAVYAVLEKISVDVIWRNYMEKEKRKKGKCQRKKPGKYVTSKGAQSVRKKISNV